MVGFLQAKKALGDGEIILKGDGLSLLYPTYVQDVIFGILKASFVSNSRGKIYYLVNPKSFTARSFADLTTSILGIHKEIVTSKEDENQSLPYNHFDIKSAAELLSWQPKVPVEQGLKKTLDAIKAATCLE